jgi:hypothetical protein
MFFQFYVFGDNVIETNGIPGSVFCIFRFLLTNGGYNPFEYYDSDQWFFLIFATV